jgi:hypothetical protein
MWRQPERCCFEIPAVATCGLLSCKAALKFSVTDRPNRTATHFPAAPSLHRKSRRYHDRVNSGTLLSSMAPLILALGASLAFGQSDQFAIKDGCVGRMHVGTTVEEFYSGSFRWLGSDPRVNAPLAQRTMCPPP